MAVCRSVMGPERILPNSEDERPADGALLPAWSAGEGEENGGEAEPDGEEEEENSGGYYYQPLNQEPEQPEEEEEEEDGGEEEEGPSHSEQLQQVQHRIEVSLADSHPTQVLPAGTVSLTCVSCR